MERHLITVYKSFGENVIERYPSIEMNMITAYHLAIEDLLKTYKHILHNNSILSGCIYVNWASQADLRENILKRGRESEIKILKDHKVYSVNVMLEKKHAHMLEVLNIPIYFLNEKIDRYNAKTILGQIRCFLDDI